MKPLTKDDTHPFDIDKIKQNVLTELNKINEALGFFNIASKPNLL